MQPPLEQIDAYGSEKEDHEQQQRSNVHQWFERVEQRGEEQAHARNPIHRAQRPQDSDHTKELHVPNARR